MKTLTGSCLCGKVHVEMPDQFKAMGNCHCSECRKFSGAAYASVGIIDSEQFRITAGEEYVSYYSKSAETDAAFCRNCGSSLFTRKRTAKTHNVRLGILDEVPSQRATFHIFVGSKAPWHDILDELPQHAERP